MEKHINLQIPENTLWIEYSNWKGEKKKGWAVIALDDSRYFKKGGEYQLVFEEPGDMEYQQVVINADLFDGARKVISLFWRDWQSVLETFSFTPTQAGSPGDD